MVLEVMGRDAGHIAIAAGIAGGADIVLIPEVRWRLDHVVERIAAPAPRPAARSALVVVAEAAGIPTRTRAIAAMPASANGWRIG